MGKKLVMLPAKDVDLSTVEYHRESIKAPKLTGFTLKLFVWLIELPIIGSWLLSHLKENNKFTQMLQNTVIPETPMFRPEFPPQEPEPGVILMDEDSAPVVRAESALECLPPYDPNRHSGNGSSGSFLYWTIRDYAHAYRSRRVTPSMVAEHVISYVEESKNKKVSNPLLISFIAEDVRKQAVASTRRFEEGRPLSILDGIFMAIKDDIDCFPHPTRGATTWFHEVRSVNEDAVCVSRLRSCGVIFVGKANLHELGLGATGNNPNYGTVRNPHSIERYTGGSSSGPGAIVSSGLCPAALGTDGGGSNRIASSLCGVVGMKTTYGRTDMSGSLYDCGTVEVIAPIASTVEDAMLVDNESARKWKFSSVASLSRPRVLMDQYAAMSGSSLEDRICMRPLPPSLPCLSSSDSSNIVGSLRFGKYTEWFNDVYSTDISDKCGDVLHLLSKTYGCQIAEIVLPELQEMRNAHLVSMGSEQMSCLNPHCIDGKGAELTLDSRIDLAVYRAFTAAEYVSAARIRRRIMYYHMEAFKKVDIIVTPTTGELEPLDKELATKDSFELLMQGPPGCMLVLGITAPKISASSLKYGESDLEVSGYLLRFIQSANLIGFPAITVPVGHDKEGLPIGLHLMGRPWGEATVFRAASVVEELCLRSRNRPSAFCDILGHCEQ